MMATKCLLLLVALVFSIQVNAFSFDVGARSEACFYEQVEQGTPVGVMFQVIAGGFLDIDVRISGPDGRVIYAGARETDGRYSFTAHVSGSYSFCFSNKMSTVTPKQIELNVDLGSNSEENFEDGNAASDEEMSPLQSGVLQLSDVITTIQHDVNYLKMREHAHRSTNESTNERVLWWSIFEISILLAMSVWQVWYFRNFFEQKRSV
eukprot:TRINITY_DN13_c0_g2_i1.p1 TRINITY_DN13_c0_g2~~TRINITY_DN13_c0_g2_i1.p1  ORF type:complete len:207 (+),score=47.04 TRINITY_DN13_c0_g2_i1:33-653(+)